jgi:hypothetical protein
VLVLPSPKSHCHEAGLPVEVSVNCTSCPDPGYPGLKAKDALREDPATTVIIRRIVLEPEPLPMVKATR